MKTWKAKTGRILVLSVILMGLLVSIQANDNFNRCFADKRLAGKLDLTDEQKESWEEIRYQSQKSRIDIQADLKKARLDLWHEMQKENPDKESIMKLADEVGEYQTELKKISLSNLIEVKQILTPEQREKAKGLLGKWKANRNRSKLQGLRKRPKDQPTGAKGHMRQGIRKQMENRRQATTGRYNKRAEGEVIRHRRGMPMGRQRRPHHPEARKPAPPETPPEE